MPAGRLVSLLAELEKRRNPPVLLYYTRPLVPVRVSVLDVRTGVEKNHAIVRIYLHRHGTLVQKVPAPDSRHAATSRAALRKSSGNAHTGAVARAIEETGGLR